MSVLIEDDLTSRDQVMNGLCILWLLLCGALIGWFLCGWLGRRAMAETSSDTSPFSDQVFALQQENENLRQQLAAGLTPVAIDLAAAKVAGFKLKSETDFTIIEGIGPKINQLMIDAGIDSFAQFSRTSVDDLQAVLDKAGARYRLANPGTWPQQAGLAANNLWDALKQLQDELDGGVNGGDS